jgi:predicted nucleic acid-binding protein
MYTLDSNILVYAADEAYPLHQRAKLLRDRAVREPSKACLCSPVLQEFFAIITDPKRTRNPMSPVDAWAEVDEYLRTFRIFYPEPGAMIRLGKLIRDYQTSKQSIFDALIVAIMLEKNVKGIYTANEDDFQRFKEIVVLDWKGNTDAS